VKTKRVILKTSSTGGGDGYIDVGGWSNKGYTRVEIKQIWPLAINSADKNKYIGFWHVPAQAIRALRKVIQERENELVEAGYLKPEVTR